MLSMQGHRLPPVVGPDAAPVRGAPRPGSELVTRAAELARKIRILKGDAYLAWRTGPVAFCGIGRRQTRWAGRLNNRQAIALVAAGHKHVTGYDRETIMKLIPGA